MAQLNIGLGLGFSSISIPDLEKDESEIHANKIEISWFGKNFHNKFSKVNSFFVISDLALKMFTDHIIRIIFFFQLLFCVLVKLLGLCYLQLWLPISDENVLFYHHVLLD